jgi:hypothetical protein
MKAAVVSKCFELDNQGIELLLNIMVNVGSMFAQWSL